MVAHAARAAGLSPNALSVLAGVIGGVGGALLASDRLALAGVGCLFVYGIFDSADGQLARLTRRTSELGRLLDGLAGYVTHTAAYLGIVVGVVGRGGSWSILGWAVLAGVFTADSRSDVRLPPHHLCGDRRSRAFIATAAGDLGAARRSPTIVAAYEAIQRRLAGRHPRSKR